MDADRTVSHSSALCRTTSDVLHLDGFLACTFVAGRAVNFDHLQIVAEVGVALVGFSGIVALFATNLGLKRGGINRLRFVDLLLSGFGAVFLSFTPGLFGFFEATADSVWLWAEVAMTCWFLATLIVLFLLGRHHPPESGFHYVFPVLGVSITIALLLSVVGVVEFQPGAVHFVGLIWLLAIASVQFGMLLLKAIYAPPSE